MGLCGTAGKTRPDQGLFDPELRSRLVREASAEGSLATVVGRAGRLRHSET